MLITCIRLTAHSRESLLDNVADKGIKGDQSHVSSAASSHLVTGFRYLQFLRMRNRLRLVFGSTKIWLSRYTQSRHKVRQDAFFLATLFYAFLATELLSQVMKVLIGVISEDIIDCAYVV